jgi:thermitase
MEIVMPKVARKTSTLKWVATLTFIALLDAMGVATAAAQGPPQESPASVAPQSSAPDQALNVQTPKTNGSPNHIRVGHILVRFKDSARQDVLNQLHADYGANVVATIPAIRVTHFQAAGSGLALLGHLRKRPDVEFAEFDSVVSTMQSAFVPNDPYYGTTYVTSHYGSIDQWGPRAVSAPAAWGLTEGSRSIVIAIVDTGVDDTHPDLASKIVGEYSYVGTIKDGFGHGTHVAGIAAGATNNNLGIAGMCPNCGILSVKVLNDQGSGYTSDIAAGITYAASHGARVISLSLGGGGRSETLHSALDYALANNALPVCAMGNAGSGSNTPEPAYWHDCLSVIATDQNGTKATFSNYGLKADVAAPGVAILSTMPTYPVTLTTTRGYSMNYDALSGTSMATPMVSGIAGLVLSQNPNLTPRQVAGIIMSSSGDGISWASNVAFGVVDAYRAVSSAVHGDYVAPVPNLVSPTDGAVVTGLVTFQAAPTDSSTVHHIDFVEGGTRFMEVLTRVSGTSSSSAGKGGKTTTITAPAWTASWPSTTVFNSSITLSAFAVDVFGNTSAAQNLDLTVQNKLVTQSGTGHLCWPSSSNCRSYTEWQPVTTGVSTQAAMRLQGTVSYGGLSNTKYTDFWLQVYSANSDGSTQADSCGTAQSTIDCFPAILLQPDGTRTLANYSGGQIALIPTNNKQSASGSALINWTLTYPQ